MPASRFPSSSSQRGAESYDTPSSSSSPNSPAVAFDHPRDLVDLVQELDLLASGGTEVGTLGSLLPVFLIGLIPDY